MEITEKDRLEAENTSLRRRYDDLMECYIKLITLGVKPSELPHPWADTGGTAVLEVVEYFIETYRKKENGVRK